MNELTLLEKAILLSVLLDAIDEQGGDTDSIVDDEMAAKIETILKRYDLDPEKAETDEKTTHAAYDIAKRLRDEILAHDWTLVEPTPEENS